MRPASVQPTRIPRGLDSGPQLVEELVDLREAARFVLRENPRTVHDDVVDPVPALDQCRPDTQGLLDFGCMTCSPRQVVSTRAVGDFDLHGAVSWPSRELARQAPEYQESRVRAGPFYS